MPYIHLRTFCIISLLIFSSLFIGTVVFAQNQADNYYQKALNYENGENGVEKNQAESVKWLMKAAEAGSIDALTNAGGRYLAGRDGFVKDEEKGCEWTQQAAEAGNIGAQVNLVKAYNLKLCGTFWNRKEKAQYWHKQVLGSDTDGAYIHQLIIFYILSNAPYRVNNQELKELILLTALRGNAATQYELAAMYHPLPFSDFGLFKADKLKAISWFKESARQGYENSIEALKKYYGITNLENSGPGTQPESISCPQIQAKLLSAEDVPGQGMITYDNRGTVIYGNAECLYEDDIKIEFRWHNYPDLLEGQRQCESQRNMPSMRYDKSIPEYIAFNKIDGKPVQYIDVWSSESLAFISVFLPKREFDKEINRPKGSYKWVDLALKLLPESESRGMGCLEKTTEKKKTSIAAPVGGTSKKKKTAQPHKKTVPTPASPPSWDSWDAPSPKAKTHN